MGDREVVTVEEFIDGDFIKYVNNTGERCVESNLVADKLKQRHFVITVMKNLREN